MILSGLIGLVACKEPGVTDREAPVITLNDPVNGEQVAAGDELHLEGLIEDNVELATWNLTIHNNFDGHQHGRLAVTAFSLDRSYPISGRRADIHEHVDIPADATAGPYHLVVKAIDKEGNATSFADDSSKEVEIWITNDEMAEVLFRNSQGSITDHFHVHAGVPIVVAGDINGRGSDLSEVRLEVGTLDISEHSHEGHRLMAEEPFFSKTITIPPGTRTTTLGTLLAGTEIAVSQAQVELLEQQNTPVYLIVRVKDADGNHSRFVAELEF